MSSNGNRFTSLPAQRPGVVLIQDQQGVAQTTPASLIKRLRDVLHRVNQLPPVPRIDWHTATAAEGETYVAELKARLAALENGPQQRERVLKAWWKEALEVLRQDNQATLKRLRAAADDDDDEPR